MWCLAHSRWTRGRCWMEWVGNSSVLWKATVKLDPGFRSRVQEREGKEGSVREGRNSGSNSSSWGPRWCVCGLPTPPSPQAVREAAQDPIRCHWDQNSPSRCLSWEPSLPLYCELFSAPFPLQALSSPSERSAIFHIILAGIKYNCVWKVQKSKLPLGIPFPISPVELKTGVSLKSYVFQAAGVLICKAHYSNKTLKQSSISYCSRPVSTPAPTLPTIGFLSSFRAQSQDLSIDILTLTFTLSLCHCIGSAATAP